VTLEVIRAFTDVPMLGVCLGHQALGMAFGGSVVRAPVPMHGKTTTVEHDGRGIFAGITSPFQASRYHSLVVADDGWPAALEVTARSKEDGLVMGLRHRTLPLHGVQFHPESILTHEGRRILRNFLEL
jgi:anthranilate synthase component 2